MGNSILSIEMAILAFRVTSTVRDPHRPPSSPVLPDKAEVE